MKSFVRWIGSGALMGLVAACGDEGTPKDEGPGSSVGGAADVPAVGRWRAGHGMGTVFLLDRMGTTTGSSVIEEARRSVLPTQNRRLADLDATALPDETAFVMPARARAGKGGALVTCFDAASQEVGATRRFEAIAGWWRDEPTLAAVRLYPARRSIEFAAHPRFLRGFPKPRTPEGRAGVLLSKPCEAHFQLQRFGGAATLSLEARFLGNWKPEDIPVLEFILDGEPLATFDIQRNRESIPKIPLPPHTGPQQLTLKVAEVLEDQPKKLVLEALVLEEDDGQDRLVVRDDVDADSIRFDLAGIEAWVPLLAAGESADRITRSLSLYSQTTLLFGQGVSAWSVSVDGAPVEGETRGRERAWHEAQGGVMQLELEAEQPLRGPLWLAQPAALYQRELSGCRREEAQDSHDRVRHVQVGDDIRRSLLVAPGGECAWSLDGLEATQVSFALGRGAPSDVGAAASEAQPSAVRLLAPPRVEVAWRDREGNETLLGAVVEPSEARWHEATFALPAEAEEFVVRCRAGGTETVAAQMQWVAVAEPTLRTPQTRRAPNVLIYLIDTLRADRLGCYGHDRPTSPHIDALAEDGVLFEHAYSQAPWTRPSIASLFTGLTYTFHGAGKRSGLVPRLLTWSELFHRNGYRTAAFVSNAQVHGKGLNFTQGFGRFVAVETEIGNTRAHEMNEALAPWFEEHHDRPFFLYVHTIDPHAKYDPPESTRGRFGSDQYRGTLSPRVTGQRNLEDRAPLSPEELEYVLALYDEEILANDAAFGALVASLKDAGVYDDTVIIVTSDHGEEFGEHGQYGHGGRLWQELLHVPLLFKGVGDDRPRGVRVATDARLIDVYPTLASYFQMEAEDVIFHGHDLTSTWGDHPPTTSHDVLAEEEPPMRALLRGGAKIIERQDKKDTTVWHQSLYDLAADPRETEDLAESQPERLQEMATHLDGTILILGQEMEPIQNLLPAQFSDADLEALRKLGYEVSEGGASQEEDGASDDEEPPVAEDEDDNEDASEEAAEGG